MSLEIVNELKKVDPKVKLFSLQYDASVTQVPASFLEQERAMVAKIAAKYQVADIKDIQAVADTRRFYKLLGASPSRYRNAAEAMLRRVVQGKDLYRINNIIDIQNMISISSGISIGSYDLTKLQGKIVYQRAEAAHYQGIGKTSVNLTSLPCLYDDAGPFGNPTSDSQRAMITDQSQHILTVFYTFSDEPTSEAAVADFLDQLSQYTDAKNIKTAII